MSSPLSSSMRSHWAGGRSCRATFWGGSPPVSVSYENLPGLSGLSYNGKFQTLLGGRSTVGQRTLTPLIGVRIPASQPTQRRNSQFFHDREFRVPLRAAPSDSVRRPTSLIV